MAAAKTETSRRGEAGRSGTDVRSDCRVALELRSSGGIKLELVSRVEAYYGNSIRAQVAEVLQALGIGNALLHIEDEGALPYVLGARMEAAARAAGCERTRSWLPQPVAHAPSTRDKLRRSRLYLPGSEPRYFINAGLHAPDGIILDLEDAVHPDEKAAARLLVRNALRAVDFGAAERMVRINQLPLGLEDLDDVIPQQPDLILIPKVESEQQVAEVDRRIGEIEQRCQLPGKIWLMPILESALGIERAFAIAQASDRIVALTVGLEDYTADLGVVKTLSGEETLYARMRLVNAAHAAGLQAIDSVFGDVGDMDGLRAWCERSRALGFEGIGCIHPTQVAVVHQAYAPSAREIEKAEKIVAAFEEAKRLGKGVVSLGSKMIDPPVVNRALKLMERARQMGLVPAAKEAGQ